MKRVNCMRKILPPSRVLLFFLPLFFIGCIHQIQLTNFETGEILPGQYNEIEKTVTVTMPNGEVLKGKYSSVSNASFSYGSVTSWTPVYSHGTVWGYSASSRGQAYALLRSNISRLMMEIIVVFSGNHGFGEARTNDGRRFRVQF